jgi:uncharacterized membrane protein
MDAAAKPHADVPVRTWRERVFQTLAFELGGLLLVSPLWTLASGESTGESLFLLVCLSAAVMTWMAGYNTAFDRAEARLSGRVASERPHRWRVVHAVGLEASSILVTWPLIALITGFGWLEALAADIGLTVAYAIYGYFFHLGFDRLRPVLRSSGGGKPRHLGGSAALPFTEPTAG